MNRRSPVPLLALLLLGVMIAACGPGATKPSGGTQQPQPAQSQAPAQPAPAAAPAAAAKPEKATLKVGIIPISNLTPLNVAQRRGYFTEQGLTVETTAASGGSQLAAAVTGGSLDFAYSNYVSVFQAVAEGFDMKIVAHQNSARGQAPDAAPMVVRNDGKVTKAADLVGKKIGINGLTNINHIAATRFLEKNGVAANQVKFVELPFPNMGDALAKGDIDAAALVEPFVTILKGQGKIEVLAYPFLEIQPGLNIAGFVASGKFVKENPETVRRFVAALKKANEYLNGNQAELVKETAEFTKMAPDLVAKVTLDPWSHTVDPQSLQNLADLSHKYGMLKKQVDTAALVHETARR